jgi:hypothetical protein
MVEAAVAHDRGEPGGRLRALGRVASRVVPDVDVRLLQKLLGDAALTDDTQRHREQMRRRLLVELGERPLVGERDPRDQLGEARVAATGSTAIA